MAGNSFFGFPTDFFDDDERSEPEVIFANIPEEFHDLYYNIASNSATYAEMNDIEKIFIANEFVEQFYIGGYSLADQEEWLAILGLRPQDFDWDEYKAIYDNSF